MENNGTKETKYRYLEAGEIIQEGDEYRAINVNNGCLEEWVSASQFYGSKCSVLEGYYKT